MRTLHVAPWSAVVVNSNGSIFLDQCLRSLTQNSHPPFEIILVDNGSDDDSLQELAGWPQVIVDEVGRKISFASAANRGVAATETDLVFLLKTDISVDSGFGYEFARAMENSETGAIGPKLVYPHTGVTQHAGGRIDWPVCTLEYLHAGEIDDPDEEAVPRAVDFVTDSAMCLRRSAFDECRGFDETFSFNSYEDVDLCLRLRASGWNVEYHAALTGTNHAVDFINRSPEDIRLVHRSRIQFAMKHLASHQWRQRFIPAELQRLRTALNATDAEDWPDITGATAIEEIVRFGLSTAPDSFITALDGSPLHESLHALINIQERAAPVGSRPPSRTLWQKLLGRPTKEETQAEQQKGFADAVVRALTAQVQLNRELYATLLLSLLMQVEFPEQVSASDSAPPLDDPDDTLRFPTF